ncbi:MAG: hypothetical protein K2N26_00425 [Oscillospiraceae bacterium]|nr:hypothetical protein [Oscillospiraceae bacterium]
MKNSVKKIIALCAAAAISAICLCTAVSAEEYIAPASYTTIDEVNNEVERVIVATGTYSNGSSYITLRNGGTCYFHIVYTNGMYVRANGTYAVQGSSFRASLNGYIVVDSNGNMQSSSTQTLGVDGVISSTSLSISDITYYKD